MPRLRDLQGAMASELLSETAGAAAPLFLGETAEAVARFSVYRDNVQVSLRKALADLFPAVKALVGERFFGHTAESFFRRQPPTSRVLSELGRFFPAFLESLEGARRHPYLADVARFELALEESLLDDEAQALLPTALADVPSEALAGVKLRFHPSRRFLQSRFPVVRIRRFALDPSAGEDRIDLGEGASHVLIVRPHADVIVHELTAGGYSFLSALDRGETLTDALDAALAVDASFDAQPVLTQHLAEKSFVSFATAPSLSSDESEHPETGRHRG